jgi:hypothetical protein
MVQSILGFIIELNYCTRQGNKKNILALKSTGILQNLESILTFPVN